MLNRIDNTNSLAFKAVYKMNDNKYTDMQRVVVEQLNNNLLNSPKDSFERNLPMVLEDDYKTDINLNPSSNENEIYVSLIQETGEIPVGVYSLNNANDIVNDIDELYPYVGKDDKKAVYGTVSAAILTIAAIAITLLSAVKCTSSTIAKNAQKAVVETKANMNNMQNVAKNTLKVFK